MRSSSPGSWDDLRWRLRAEAAAALAGDFQAVTVLAAGATLSEPTPDAETLADVLHLQARLVRSLVERVQETSRRIALLRLVSPADAGPRHLDVRR